MTCKNCVICDKEISSGRKMLSTEEVICDSQTCWGEWFLNNSNKWG